MAAAILTQMLPADFQDTVLQSQGTGEFTYEVIKDKVLAIAGTKIQQAAPTPMDVGEVNRDAGLIISTTTTTTTRVDLHTSTSFFTLFLSSVLAYFL